MHEVFLFEVFHALFVLNDVDCSNTMELDEFLDCLKLFVKTDYDADFAHRLRAEFDIDDSGTIDGNEFSQIMVCRVLVSDVIGIGH